MKRIVLALAFLGFAAGGSKSGSPAGPTGTRIIELSGNLGFGEVAIGSTATAALTIRNTGTAALSVTAVSISSGFSGNWASGTIAPGASRSVTVTFSPTASANYVGSVAVTSDATSGGNTISISGMASLHRPGASLVG